MDSLWMREQVKIARVAKDFAAIMPLPIRTANPASTEAMLCGAAAKLQAIDFSSWWVLFFFFAQRSFGVASLYRLTWLTFGN
jgi:hypothetical protein